MKCDELKWKWAYGPYLDPPEGQEESAIKAGYVKVVSKQSADAAIAELKKKLMPCLNGDCILTCEVVEKYGKENAELKAEIESLKASHYAEMVDAGMRERRLRRALWLARANDARNSYLKWNLFANFESEDKLFTIDEYDEMPGVTDFKTLRTYAEWCKVWQNVGRKCLAKAEEYK